MRIKDKINHNTSEMHKLFADSLFDLIFEDHPSASINGDTMYAE